MPHHRGHNEGTIYQTDAGRWRAQVSLISGRRMSRTCRTRKEAQVWLNTVLKQQQDGALVEAGRLTLGDFLDRWLADVVTPSRRPATVETYNALIRANIKPLLGHYRLVALRPDHVQRFYTDRLNAGLSKTTVSMLHAILHRALAQALRWGLVVRNITDAVQPPRPTHRRAITLSLDDTQRLLAAIAGDRLYALYLLAITTGMREGELLALRWPDVDLDAAMIQVRGTLRRARGVVEIGEPKGGRARQVALAPAGVEALRQHRRQQAEEARLLMIHNEQGFLFTTPRGVPYDRVTILRQFRALLGEHGFPTAMRFHDLRHTAATLALARGVHPKIVQEVLGHSRISMTMDTYSHVLPTMQQDMARAMQEIVGALQVQSPANSENS